MMESSYEPGDLERRWYATWEEAGCFAPAAEGRPYSIMLPPPNVTGRLHMGHAFQHTLMDALCRYRRMQGDAVMWQPGTDHAGIATQMVVERRLAAEGKSRHDLGREAFVEAVWEWKEESGGSIQAQLRRLGASLDWDHERFTMEPDLNRAVTEAFVRLWEDGLIYRGKRLVNWDPVLHTALSDLEVDASEENGHLWHIRYPCRDGSGHLVVATTRPETLLGDTAVAVHPDDERYAELVGGELELPLTGRSIPVIADEYVDPEFGSGCVKITRAHDFDDYEVGKRHDLPVINVLNPDATLNDDVPEAYRGLDRAEARRRIVADLEEQGLLDRVEDHRLVIPRGDRSGAVLEPYLTDQWFVHIAPLAEPALEAVREGRVQFVPDNWSRTYFNWMERIEDWCISRQLWWGHRIPAWYDDDGNIHVGHDEADARRRSGLGDDVPLRQDEDVLDTWFSSALWPFSTQGWPDGGERLERFYPSSVLVTGFDIIFFWVARMIMAGLRFMDDVPFHDVYVTGLIRDADGQKMSKSKGNVLDPIDLVDGIGADELVAKRTSGLMQPQMAPKIERATRKEFPDGIPAFGCDAVRFTFAALATHGRDIRFDLDRVEGYRNFCNKLWNAARFVLLQDTPTGNADGAGNWADRWIRSRLGRMLERVAEHIDGYRFDLAAQALYDFIWNEYCDWYVELSKPVLRGDDPDAAAVTHRTLLEVLEAALRALHPIMPFITEDIWQRLRQPLGRDGNTIMLQSWPDAPPADAEAEAHLGWLREVVHAVRRIRSELDLPPASELPLHLQAGDDDDRARAAEFTPWLQSLARVAEPQWLTAEAADDDAAVALVGSLKILIPLGGLVDIEAELERLDRQLQRERSGLERCQAKMKNPRFVDNAPAEVVEQERARVAAHEARLRELQAQRERIVNLDE